MREIVCPAKFLAVLEYEGRRFDKYLLGKSVGQMRSYLLSSRQWGKYKIISLIKLEGPVVLKA